MIHLFCVFNVRHPVDRFVSYYMERSDHHFEREVCQGRSLEHWTEDELRQYLDLISIDKMNFTGHTYTYT